MSDLLRFYLFHSFLRGTDHLWLRLASVLRRLHNDRRVRDCGQRWTHRAHTNWIEPILITFMSWSLPAIHDVSSTHNTPLWPFWNGFFWDIFLFASTMYTCTPTIVLKPPPNLVWMIGSQTHSAALLWSVKMHVGMRSEQSWRQSQLFMFMSKYFYSVLDLCFVVQVLA